MSDDVADGITVRDPGPRSGIDWEALRVEAVRMTTLAYAPYSHFRVGVAGLVDDGRMVSGCNVENAAYGMTLCAECGMVSELHATGRRPARRGVVRRPERRQPDAVRPVPTVAVGERNCARLCCRRPRAC